eukprot:TRINITY_DN132_c5_g1_i1.p1 TRINITY_DN132_c5_g1~~TRINITY_DN132_c5_g1_i1.p1  ORF type:complete len:240 (-),score=66.67 TRINITY_DN132_c5_g1_i1:129-824(-)
MQADDYFCATTELFRNFNTQLFFPENETTTYGLSSKVPDCNYLLYRVYPSKLNSEYSIINQSLNLFKIEDKNKEDFIESLIEENIIFDGKFYISRVDNECFASETELRTHLKEIFTEKSIKNFSEDLADHNLACPITLLLYHQLFSTYDSNLCNSMYELSSIAPTINEFITEPSISNIESSLQNGKIDFDQKNKCFNMNLNLTNYPNQILIDLEQNFASILTNEQIEVNKF